MKKILSVAAAIALAAALISCGGNSDEFDGKVDTVLTIGAPSVTAKAYPGVNYITWEPVASAKSYEVYRIADGDANGKRLETTSTKTSVADVAATGNLADGKTYKYVVVAIPANAGNSDSSGNAAQGEAQIPSRAIYMKANQGSASVKAYVPAAGTEISAFTDSYTKNFISKNYKDADTVSKNKKIAVKVIDDPKAGAKIAATYPATAGFKFGVKFINSTLVEKNYEDNVNVGDNSAYLEDYIGNSISTAITDAGKYEAYLSVQSVSELYPTPVTFKLGEKVVKAIGEKNATSNVTATYAADGKTVTVSWIPATLKSTGKASPKENYYVYKCEGTKTNGSVLTDVCVDPTKITVVDVAGDNTTGSSTTDPAYITQKYTVTDTIENNAIDYTYVIVHKVTIDGEVEVGASKTASLTAFTLKNAKPATFNTATKVIDKDSKNLQNTIKLVVNYNEIGDTYTYGSPVVTSNVEAAQTVTLSYVYLDSLTSDYKKTLSVADFDKNKVTLSNEDSPDKTRIGYVEAAKVGTYLFKLTTAETGKNTVSEYKVITVDTLDCKTNNLNWYFNGTDDKKACVWETGALDDFANYTYNLVTVVTTTNYRDNSKYADYITVETKTTKLDMAARKIETTATAANNDYVKYSNGQIAAQTAEYQIVAAIASDIAPESKDKDKKIVKEYYLEKVLTGTTKHSYKSTGTSLTNLAN